jgi:hypothetical protein
MNAPVTTPPDTEQEGVPLMRPGAAIVIVQLVSPELNPEPETWIVSFPLPLLGESDIDGAVTVNVSDTDPWTTTAFVNVTV